MGKIELKLVLFVACVFLTEMIVCGVCRHLMAF